MSTDCCPECNTRLPADSPGGLCPKCLMAAGIESDAHGPRNGGMTTPHTPVSGSGRRFIPPTPDELAPHFPQFEILSLVGSGGMGAVYKARQRELDRIVALKILPPQLGEDPAFVERFTREARAMAKLSHPNIVAIFDFGRADNLCYFTMEYVDGTSLRDVIKTEKIEQADAVSLAGQVCDALQFAHQQGVVHRDVKPENILVSKLGRVKITDFGLAKIVFDAAQQSALTGTAELLGTFRYMAPEQLEQSKTVDHRADIYALGIVLYELLTGEVPMGRFQSPSEKSHSDPRLDDVVLQALERDPDRRFQQAGDLKSALDSMGNLSTAATNDSTFTARWLAGTRTGIWTATSPKAASGWVVGLRVLIMLVACAGTMLTCFLTWNRVRVVLLDPPPSAQRAYDSWRSDEVAYQFSLGWESTAGKFVALAFGVLLLHLMGNLGRLRWLKPVYIPVLLVGIFALAVSTWSINRPSALTNAPIRWGDSPWGVPESSSGDGTAQEDDSASLTPREHLEKLANEFTSQQTSADVSQLSNKQLIEMLAQRGKVQLAGYYDPEGPYTDIGLGIALVFFGLLEFAFIHAAEPTRRMLRSSRSSVIRQYGEPRISKIAIVAAVLGLLPIIPLMFLGMFALESLDRDYSSYGEEIAVSFGFLVGLSILPITFGMLATYDIRRSRGMLHGLPLAFTAWMIWPLIIFNAVVMTIAVAAAKDPSAFAVIIVTFPVSVTAFIVAWRAFRHPMDMPPPPHNEPV